MKKQRRPTFLRRHEVTLPGLVFVGITLFVMIAAINSQTNLLFFMFGILIGGLIVSVVVSGEMQRKLRVRRMVNDHVVVGELLEVHYQITNPRKHLASFAVSVTEAEMVSGVGDKLTNPLSIQPQGYALHIAPRQTVTVMTRLGAARRGILRLNEVRLTCSFPFGFLRHVRHLKMPLEIVVYPRIGVLNRKLAMRYREAITPGSMTSNVRGGNDDFYGLREYRAGDNIRAIHWRRTARTGQLMIREMTSNAPPQMVVVLDLRHWKELAEDKRVAEVERAIELAASLVCYGFAENFAVGLSVAGVEGAEAPVPQMGREVRQRLLHRLATLEVEDIGGGASPLQGAKLGRRAEYVIIGLRGLDETEGLVPVGTTRTALVMDDAESETWLHFLAGDDARRLLREAQ